MITVAVMGLGLMGGSLGLALKRCGGYRVVGCTRSAENGKRALERGAVDAMARSPREAVEEADIVVLCAPILAIPAQLESIAASLKPGAVVTDVGSTKADLQDACRRLTAGSGAVFIGSHPIAGSEQQGMEAAREDLYRNAMVVVTPDDDAAAGARERVEQMWRDAGARIFEMSADEHDRVLALTSHLPHLVAALLADTVGRPGLREDVRDFCGTGFLDTSRVAAGGTDIWLDILKTNRDAVLQELLVFREKLDLMIEKLEVKDFIAIEKALEDGRVFRKSFED